MRPPQPRSGLQPEARAAVAPVLPAPPVAPDLAEATASASAAIALVAMAPAAAAAPASTPATPANWIRRTIPRLEGGGDIEQYLTTFERLATAYQWPRQELAVLLMPYLSGRARSAYVAMDIGEAVDHDRVKEVILNKYEINEKVYRRRFRDPDIRPGEIPQELYTRLKDLFNKWVQPATRTIGEVSEIGSGHSDP